jgi:peptidoglycan/LPS O-acetylase OafA/YrhL
MQSKFYRPELDVLRFVAFAFVFFFHTASSIRGEMSSSGGIQPFLSTVAMAGSYGVDIFFLLSSYLITTLLLQEKDRTGTIDTRSFYARRILRIWPLYFIFIVSTICLSRFTSVQFPNGAIAPMLLFYGNFWLMFNNFFSPAGILWSVSVEEQFYLFSPLATRFTTRRGLITLASILIVIAMVARFVLVKSAIVTPYALWFCTLTRLDPIATGILVCLLLGGRVPSIRFVARVALFLIGAICLCTAAVGFHGIDKDLSLTDTIFAYPVADIGALAIFLSFLGAQIVWGPLIYLGQISYGLYVYHLFALDAAKVWLLHFMGECPFWLRAAIALPITIGLAAVSYAWVEKPFLRLKERFSGESAKGSRGVEAPAIAKPHGANLGLTQ